MLLRSMGPAPGHMYAPSSAEMPGPAVHAAPALPRTAPALPAAAWPPPVAAETQPAAPPWQPPWPACGRAMREAGPPVRNGQPRSAHPSKKAGAEWAGLARRVPAFCTDQHSVWPQQGSASRWANCRPATHSPAGQAPPPGPAGTQHLKLAIGPLDMRLQLCVLLLQRHCLALQVCQLVLQRGWSVPDMQSNAFSGSPAGHGVMIAEGDWQLPTDVLSGCPLV